MPDEQNLLILYLEWKRDVSAGPSLNRAATPFRADGGGLGLPTLTGNPVPLEWACSGERGGPALRESCVNGPRLQAGVLLAETLRTKVVMAVPSRSSRRLFAGDRRLGPGDRPVGGWCVGVGVLEPVQTTAGLRNKRYQMPTQRPIAAFFGHSIVI